ncbi:hypothetical protein F5Y14DRAFT_424382 [Nemania sp. NC0429]|nr:hypothetical protein F5Y14DRAFT_424382 [Nemania sp. NC0429]
MSNMPPSLSTIERGNPPPRRKSCAACIKAKRRCDLRQPSCLRCWQRKIDCSYPTPSGGGVSKSRGDTASSRTGTGSNPTVQPLDLVKAVLPDMAPWDTTAGFDFNMDLSPAYNHAAPCPSYPPVAFDFDSPAIPGLEFLDDAIEDVDSMLHSFSPMPGLPSAPADPLPVAVRPSRPLSAGISRIQLLRAVSDLIDKRLRYSVDAFKSAPAEMVLDGGTPWSHPAVYRDSMPACLEDALAACALHRAKNAVNSQMIQRVIELRYQRLLAAPTPATGATTSVSDLLARTHALLLYQVMLFFDESAAARALAEETASALGDSAMALLQFVRHENEDDDEDDDPSRDIPLYPLTAARALFADWTFQESVRRTLLVSFMLIQLQCLMRADFSVLMPAPSSSSSLSSGGGQTNIHVEAPPCVSPDDTSTLAAIRLAIQQSAEGSASDGARCDSRMLLCRSLTLSAHLWHARDPVDFAVAWRDRRHLVAQPWNIWRRIDVAQPDDIDRMGRMLMTSGMGMAEAKAWFASKGSSL